MILTILSVIGKILLILLVIIICLLLYLLFVPFQYWIHFRVYDDIYLSFDLSSFLKFLRVHAEFNGQLSYQVGILWNKKILMESEKDSDNAEEIKTEAGVSEAESELYQSVKTTYSYKKTYDEDDLPDAFEDDDTDDVNFKTDDQSEKEDTDKGSTQKNTKKKKKAKTKKKESDSGLNLKRILKEVTDQGNRNAVALILKELGFLLKKIKPNQTEADVVYSLGDPDTTGYLTGAIAQFPFAYGQKVSIIPDFTSDDPFFEGNGCIRGNIYLIDIVIVAVKLFIDKDFRNLLDKF